jgi:phage tail-like protein
VADEDLLRAFRFRVSLLPSPAAVAGGEPVAPSSAPPRGGLGDGGFAECSGLDIEMDVQELREGGRNNGLIRRVGGPKYQNVVLKRGMLLPRGGTADPALWRWLQDVLDGVRPVRRLDGLVEVMSVGDTVGARWAWVRGLPAKVSGPQLNARTGEIAIEELTIAHEGLRLVTG